MNKFQSLFIKDSDISIISLQDLEDLKQESDILHHCVFASSYYMKEDGLILSVQVDGEQTETIEYKTYHLKKSFNIEVCKTAIQSITIRYLRCLIKMYQL